MVNEVRVPTEWVDDAEEVLNGINEAGIDLDPATVVFRDEKRYEVPAGFSIHFERELPFREEDE